MKSWLGLLIALLVAMAVTFFVWSPTISQKFADRKARKRSKIEVPKTIHRKK